MSTEAKSLRRLALRVLGVLWVLVAQVGLTRPCALHGLVRRVIGSGCRVERRLLRLLLRWSVWTVASGSDGPTELVLSIRLTVLLRRSELARLAELLWLAVLTELIRSTLLAWLTELIGAPWLTWLARSAELVLSTELSGPAWLSRMYGGSRLTLRTDRTVGLATVGLATIGRAESTRAVVGAWHVRHWGRVWCTLGHRACLRMRGNVIANREFLVEEGKHREYARKEGNQSCEERKVRSDVPELDRGQQVDEREGERSTGQDRDRLIKAERTNFEPAVAEFADEDSRHDQPDSEYIECQGAHRVDGPLPQRPRDKRSGLERYEENNQ